MSGNNSSGGPTMKPTPKQQRFADLLIAGVNDSDAYRQAYDAQNMSPESINREAHALVRNPKIATIVEAARAATRHALQIDANDVAEELRRIGFADLSQLVSWSKDGVTLKDSDDLPPELTALVAEVQETRHKDGSASVKIMLHDKLGALDRLAKISGMYRDEKAPDTSVQITKVTVVLNHGPRNRDQELPDPPHIVDGEARLLPGK